MQTEYDDAMYDFSVGEHDLAIGKFRAILEADPAYFDAQLALGMAYFRKADYPTAIAEGHKAEKMRPDDPLVHTNLSLFYMKNGDKTAAERHGLKARVASWKTAVQPGAQTDADPGLPMAQEKTAPAKPPARFPDMPWKKDKP